MRKPNLPLNLIKKKLLHLCLSTLVLKPKLDLAGLKPQFPAQLTPLGFIWMGAVLEKPSFHPKKSRDRKVAMNFNNFVKTYTPNNTIKDNSKKYILT